MPIVDREQVGMYEIEFRGDWTRVNWTTKNWGAIGPPPAMPHPFRRPWIHKKLKGI